MSPPSVAHQVLANPQFFSMITPWMSGWPGLVLQRWRHFQATQRVQQDTDDYVFTKMLVEHDDRRALQLVVHAAVWRHHSDPNTLLRFRFRLNDAVAVGDLTLVVRTFESNEWVRYNVTAWTWLTAVATFQGDCAVLDLIKAYATPSWTETRICSQLFRRDLLPQALELFQTVDLACLQWFLDNFGVSCLPRAIRQRLDARLVRFRERVTRAGPAFECSRVVSCQT